MTQNPTDMRMGVNCLSDQVKSDGPDPTNGEVCIL